METLKVLIPVDFSTDLHNAKSVTTLIKGIRPIEIFLLHVIAANTSLEELEDTEDQIQKQLARAKKKFEDLQTQFEFKFDIKVGPVTSTITNFSAEIQADLIVMETKGASGYMEFISGSEAQHVARYSSIPVISVHNNNIPAKLQNILLVSDFENPAPHPQLALIKTLAAAGAKIHLLHILKPDELTRVDSITMHMNTFARQNHLENFELHLHKEDKVDQGVYHFNKDHEMDLVCIGTHARKGLSHLLHGSIAERLINHCSKPVLTYHLNN